jgi:predicted MPP superfamily phosphohydrolase
LGLSFGAVQPPWLGLLALRWIVALIGLPLASISPVISLISLVVVQALILAVAAWATLVEPFRLQVSQVDLELVKLPHDIPGVSIVQLSDLHVERQSPRERALPSVVANLNPDIIFLTGDYLSTSYQDDPQAIADLKALLGQLRAPGGVYAVWGTIEVDLPYVLRPVFEEMGVVVLDNEAQGTSLGDQNLWIMGVTPTGNLEKDGNRVRTLLAEAPTASVTILLYHLPDLMPQVVDLGIDLYLAGHTHGGQWRVPGFGAIVTSSRYWKRFEAGLYQEGDSHLYVSRGLGMEGFGTPRARVFCQPEVVLLNLASPANGGEHSD